MNLVQYSLNSEFQSGTSAVDVLLPDGRDGSRRHPVLYVLPVFAGSETGVGDSLAEIGKHDLHNRYGLICVRPVFNATPWYADHPSDPGLRQESHLLRAVLPFVERTFPILPEGSGRLLAGFSKSGWGAFSLLLRNPGLFGGAAAWDAPFMQPVPDRWHMQDIFQTQENFEAYRVPALLENASGAWQRENRLVLMGYDRFRDHVIRAHELMAGKGIPHTYQDGPARPHRWDSGWLPDAVRFLCE